MVSASERPKRTILEGRRSGRKHGACQVGRTAGASAAGVHNRGLRALWWTQARVDGKYME